MNQDTISRMILLIPAMLMAITVHECAHGWMAWRRGDDTAKLMGRLSLNPLVHLDLFGTAMLLLTGFIGWAKPVPVNPWRLRRPAVDMVWVALAGPAANLALMLAMILGAKALLMAEDQVVRILPMGVATGLFRFLLMAALINMGLAFFNLLPVPPLDGFRVAAFFLPPEAVRFCQRFQIVFFIALLLLMRAGVFSRATGFLQRSILGLL
jgi:Zn-dependent protease